MNSEILKLSIQRGLLLDKEVYDVLNTLKEEEAKEIIEILSSFKKKIITKSFFVENAEILKSLTSNGERFVEKVYINLGLSIEISREIEKKREVADNEIKSEQEMCIRNLKVINSVANITKKIEVGDFVKYFRARFNELRAILQQRPGLENLVSINKITGQRQNLSIVGIVYKKRVTKNKNLILELEDLTGKLSVLVSQNKPDLYKIAEDVVLDGVIGVRGTSSNNWFFANEIFYPDASLAEKNSLERDEYAVFTSDVHLGSRNFLEKNFLKFLDWINGEVGDEKQREEARKVKFLFLTGDNVEGVGVYPGQESFLDIKDINKQYERLAELLAGIRKDITIILCPGQHDAVRIAEPQPALGEEYASALHKLDNLILVSNPALIEINNNGKKGLKVLMYHGASMIHIINEVERLRSVKAQYTPSKAAKYMLRIRHLCPMHSSVTYIPTEERDELLIKEVPDIFTTADLHKADVDVYNNILIICSSCWQSTTPFEEKVGNHPDPCKVPVLNLKTRQIKILDFSGEDEKEKNCEEKDNAVVCEVKGK